MSHQETSREPRFTGNNFIVNGALLTINVSDSNDTWLPPETMKTTEKGTVQWYHQETITSATSKHWRAMIAQELCVNFLGYHSNRKYVLTAFPTGYYLYTCREGTNVRSRASRDNIRRDAYLYGGDHKFRSPAETFCHFAWLMRDKPPNRCRCIYDTSQARFKRKQGPLNTDLRIRNAARKNRKLKEEHEEKMACFRKKKPYYPPPPPVDSFNDETYLEPAD